MAVVNVPLVVIERDPRRSLRWSLRYTYGGSVMITDLQQMDVA